MARFVLLLRGINVGKGNRLPMAELRSLLESLGLSNVRTVLNSGNAVFCHDSNSTDSLADLIQVGIRKKFGLDIHTHVLLGARFSEIVSENPLLPLAHDHSRLLAIFAKDANALGHLAKNEHLLAPGEHFSAGKYAGYLLCPSGISDSAFAGAMLGRLGAGLTSRNWNTVAKLAELLYSS
jgi:uncharacterized protein (DUF1697 family)